MEHSCLGQCTIHAHQRTSVGRRVLEALDEANRLIEEGVRFKEFGFKPLPKIVDPLPQIKTFGLETMLSQLHDLFQQGDSNIIGVWGQGGVGKTTLLHVFNNDLEKKAHEYQVVIFIEVSNSKDMNTEIQQTISERLNLPWDDKDPIARVRFLVKALVRKIFVILLDDVRKKFQLEDVGIPTPDTNSQSKLIITSRDREVCCQMNAQRSLIEMQILGNDASWELFFSKLGKKACEAVESLGSHDTTREDAMRIARSCGGLPLALNVIGTVVPFLEKSEWKSTADAIDTNMENIGDVAVGDMFSRLKYSYDRLTATQQQCFLYCTLFPEYGSISKDKLVEYWLAEGLLLDDSEKGLQIICGLVSSCLLQASGSVSSKVKMQHVIRQLGLWLVNKSDTKLLFTQGWPWIMLHQLENGMKLQGSPSCLITSQSFLSRQNAKTSLHC